MVSLSCVCITVNPGVCPSRTIDPGMCALIRFVSCVDDSECTNNQKCCSNGCGLQCMDPVTGILFIYLFFILLFSAFNR